MLLADRSGKRWPFVGRRRGDAEQYISSAAATIFGPSKKGLWAMLSVYLDDSGTHRGSAVCVVAGVLAPPLRWEKLTRSWVRILEREEIPEFHASDCACGGGLFRSWPKEKRNDLYVRLVNLTRRLAAFRVWTAIGMDDYRLNHPDDEKEKYPYTLCAVSCASWIRALARKRDCTIPYVFDQGAKGNGIFASFEDLVRWGERIIFGLACCREANGKNAHRYRPQTS